MKQLKRTTILFLTILYALSFSAQCLADSSAGHSALRNGYFPSEAVPAFQADRLTAGGDSAALMGSAAVGRYSGIVFEDETGPYCVGADRAWNTDHGAYVTAVGDQGDLGTCWLFSGFGTLESAILKQVGEPLSLSELYAYYAVSNSAEIISNPYPVYHYIGYEYPASVGGNEDLLMAYLARGTLGAAVTEADLPYSFRPSAKKLDEIQALGDRCAVDYYASQMITLGANREYSGSAYDAAAGAAYIRETKDLIKAFGGVTAGYHDSTEDSDYVSEDGYAGNLFVQNAFITDHQVELVGWDDDYGSSGAFLVKNSWGKSWNGDGYFWMSYNCYYTGVMAIPQVCRASDLFDRIYETDSSAMTLKADLPAGAGCLLKRSYTTADREEDLTGIMICNATPDTSYTVYVTDDDVPTADSLWFRPGIRTGYALTGDGSSGTVTAEDIGYLTLAFTEPVRVGGSYTIAVAVENLSGDYQIFGTYSFDSLADSADASVLSARASAFSDCSEFADAAPKEALNFVLKAFTKSLPAADWIAIPAVYGAGAAFASDGSASVALNGWQGTDGPLPVFASPLSGTPDPFFSAEICETSLTLSADPALTGRLAVQKLSAYAQRCYIGFRDPEGVEFRVPVTLGQEIAPDGEAQLIVLFGVSPAVETVVFAAGSENGQFRSARIQPVAFTESGNAFIRCEGGETPAFQTVFLLDHALSPTAVPITLRAATADD